MYSKTEISHVRRKFWTVYGQYIKPIPSAGYEPVNWINYKTGITNIYFRQDVDFNSASIAIELTHTDVAIRHQYFNRLVSLKDEFDRIVKEQWDWIADVENEDGIIISRIGKTLSPVNIMNEQDWSQIISFLKPRIIALDEFWQTARDIMEL